jgi:putative peptidoglycan lipid II flippase
MVKLFKQTFSLFTKQQNSIISAASVIMIAVLLSRILGLFRDRMLAARFSPSELGVYYAAFRLPNMIFELLVMGVLATAFIPVFTTLMNVKGKQEAFRMSSSVINIGILFFVILSIPILFFTTEVSKLLAPGFNKDQIAQMANFTRIMVIAQVFPLIVGNFFTGILQSYRNFLIPSLAPVVYNIGIIISIIFLSGKIGIYAPVFGVVLGAFLFFLIQVPFVLNLGYRHSLFLSIKDAGTREVGKLMLPRTLGLAVSQIDTTIDLVLSTLLGASSVTTLNFALHLQQVPIGLFGASIAQATLPSFSSYFAQNKTDEFKKIFISSFQQILFLVIPISSILIVLRVPLVRLVFGASNLFDWESTVLTGQTLAFFSISLFAQAQIHLLARAFFAYHDSRTPVIIGAITVMLNTILSIVFISVLHLKVWSLGLSASIASIINMLLLLIFFDQKIGGLDRKELYLPAFKIILAGAVTAFALYIPIKLFDQLVFDTTKTFNLMILTGISTTVGIGVYLFVIWFLDVPQISVLVKLFRRVPGMKKDVLIDTTNEVVNS